MKNTILGLLFVIAIIISVSKCITSSNTGKKYNTVSMGESLEKPQGIKEIIIDMRNIREGNAASALNKSYFLCIKNGVYFGPDVNALRISENKPITIIDTIFTIPLPVTVDKNVLRPIKDIIPWPSDLGVDDTVLAGILDINIQGGGGFSRIGNYYYEGQAYINKWIEYIYVNKDCTLVGKAFNRYTDDFERQEGRGFSITLYKGWNAIMRTQTVKDSYLWEMAPAYPLDEEPRWSMFL